MNAQAKVFIGHPVLTRKEDGEVEWKFSLKKVAEYGTPSVLFHNPEPVLEATTVRTMVWERLSAMGFDPAMDFFLIAGDGTLTCLMVEVAIQHWGRAPRYLRWDGKRKAYDVCGG